MFWNMPAKLFQNNLQLLNKFFPHFPSKNIQQKSVFLRTFDFLVKILFQICRESTKFRQFCSKNECDKNCNNYLNLQ